MKKNRFFIFAVLFLFLFSLSAAAKTPLEWFQEGCEADNPRKQIKCFSRAIRQDPEFVPAYKNRAIAYAQTDELEDALYDFNKVLELEPENLETYLLRGSLHEKLGNLYQAFEDYSLAILLKPGDIEIYRIRAKLLTKMGKTEQAKEDLKRVSQLETGSDAPVNESVEETRDTPANPPPPETAPSSAVPEKSPPRVIEITSEEVKPYRPPARSASKTSPHSAAKPARPIRLKKEMTALVSAAKNILARIFPYLAWIFVFLAGFLVFLKLLHVWHSRHDFGLAEGPATSMELKKDTQLRVTYSNFREQMFQTLSSKYDDIQVIAAGGMGIIVSALDKYTGQKVAIKTIAPKLHKNPKAIKFFFQECEAIQKMNHPNILRIYESSDEGFLYYVMEFLEGETLEELMTREGILPVKRIVRIGTQVARALQHCHSNGIVHRDIKPSNIFITKNNNVCKIIDFGVVKMLDSQTHETGAIGSPNYAAPEQLQVGTISGKSDIYALGVCLFKMSSGQYPYDASDLSTKIVEKPKDLKQMNPSIPAELVEIINGCIAMDPKERLDANRLWTRLRAVRI
jgi:tRNA A-37 threonylcarbamoyl transferase component Bud32